MTIAVKSIKLTNFLSFGPDAQEIELRDLNLLIGANGSGKSNLLEAFGLLRSLAPFNDKEGEPNYVGLQTLLGRGSGVHEWLWQSKPGAVGPTATIEVLVPNPSGRFDRRSDQLRHVFSFTSAAQSARVVDEKIENHEIVPPKNDKFFYFRYDRGRPIINTRKIGEDGWTERKLEVDAIDQQRSVLSQRTDSELYPELSFLANTYSLFRSYRRWTFGYDNPARHPQPANLSSRTLNEDGSNLSHVLDRLQQTPALPLIESYLRSFYWDYRRVGGKSANGTQQLYLLESNFRPVLGDHLSDGTLRWLWLLAMLLNPTPPPLICLEEPELGLHPDMIPVLARLLRDASTRTQLIVTTHSDDLISQFNDTPESVLVFEKDEGATKVRQFRNDQLADLQEWLKDYSLGQLRAKGFLGGNPF